MRSTSRRRRRARGAGAGGLRRGQDRPTLRARWRAAECGHGQRVRARRGVPLFVAYRRALPRFLRARDLVANGALGRMAAPATAMPGAAPPRRRGARWRRRRAPLASRGGARRRRAVPRYSAAARCDILDFILGPLEGARHREPTSRPPATGRRRRREIALAAAAPPGTAQWNIASAVRADEIVIAGERSTALSTFGNDLVVLRRGDSTEQFDSAIRRTSSSRSNPDHRRSTARPRRCDSTGISAARTSAVMDAVLLGYYGTRADGFWRAPEAWPGRRLSARS